MYICIYLAPSRSILKPRHEDAGLFVEGSKDADFQESLSMKRRRRNAKYSLENEDGSIEVEKDWGGMERHWGDDDDDDEYEDSFNTWNWGEERTSEKTW